jgi:hypothetical protein
MEGDDEHACNDFVSIYTHLDKCIQVLCASTFASLSKLSLQNRLDEIGRVRDGALIEEPPR